MHPIQEYTRLITAVLNKAQEILSQVPSAHREEVAAVWNFLARYGHYGFPSAQTNSFGIGVNFLTGAQPSSQKAGITIVPYFSDEIPRSAQEKEIAAGRCFNRDQMIALYWVDHFSVTEIALTLFHEARHARHRIGPSLAGLQPLDPDQLHETNTWIFTFNLAAQWFGQAWERVVRKEEQWLHQKNPSVEKANEFIYEQSNIYWPEFDELYPATEVEMVRKARQQFIGIQANMRYWPTRNAAYTPEIICHSLVNGLLHY